MSWAMRYCSFAAVLFTSRFSAYLLRNKPYHALNQMLLYYNTLIYSKGVLFVEEKDFKLEEFRYTALTNIMISIEGVRLIKMYNQSSVVQIQIFVP